MTISTSTKLLSLSEAEGFVRDVAKKIGLTDDSEILTTVCAKMREEYVIARFQLSTLDSRQWEKLHAPIGLATAVKYMLTLEFIEVDMQKPTCSSSVEDEQQNTTTKNNIETEDLESRTVELTNDDRDIEIHHPSGRSISKTQKVEEHDNNEAVVAGKFLQAQEVQEIDKNEAAAGRISLHNGEDSEGTKENNECVHGKCCNPNQNKLVMDIGESFAAVGDPSADDIQVAPVDIIKYYVDSSCTDESREADDVPCITPTTSSDEDDDPAEVATSCDVVFWWEQECKPRDCDTKENDDDTTVVVSNVSPERKNSVNKMKETKRECSPMIEGMLHEVLWLGGTEIFHLIFTLLSVVTAVTRRTRNLYL
jgi:hypothetical protein